ncbi:uncharacterized protein LOC133918057 [Phragmites australis]|uniref:uncharacterized protein LOC133918057 n=1 Tax=Phragmites australis TaxID=29695 RepID=UPI002D76533D|nr:uncharacterized protein LOC133918057 [Phragmites australis]
MSSCAAETGLVAMDCLVVCCCCPCLVLQVTHCLPPRQVAQEGVVVKTKRIILNRWHGRSLEELLDLDDGFEGAFGIGEGCTDGWKESCFAVDDDGDSVWEALVEQEGLFWFGSFWGRPGVVDPASGDDQMDAGFRLPVVLECVLTSYDDVHMRFLSFNQGFHSE